jgi:hypothetical protein
MIAENLLAQHAITNNHHHQPQHNSQSSSTQILRSFSSTNRLINKDVNSFIKDWEIVNLSELEHKLRKEIEIENEYKTLPKLNSDSMILKDDHLRKVKNNFKDLLLDLKDV